MRARCNNPNHPNYPDYGGRGIKVDPRWDDFAQFLADMGDRPTSLYSLDRVDVEGPYAPENCEWATRSQQRRNQRDFGSIGVKKLPDYIEECVDFLERHAPDKLR
jgi:hypothetical protein